MKCKTIHKNLIYFLEGDLPEEQMQEVKAHLSRCTECAAFAEDMKKTLGVVQLEISDQASPFFYTRVKARMEREKENEIKTGSLFIREKILQPALFVTLLLAGVYTGIKIGSNTGTQRQAPDYTQIEVVPYLNEMEAEPLESFLME